MNVYKYPLNQYGPRIEVPKGSKFLSVGSIGNDLFIWFIVDPNEKETDEYRFICLWTGDIVPQDINKLKFLGTHIGNGFDYHIWLDTVNDLSLY